VSYRLIESKKAEYSTPRMCRLLGVSRSGYYARRRRKPSKRARRDTVLRRKIESIQAYESQFITGRPTEPPTLIDRLRDDAANWGRLIDRRYGEPFATKEPLALQSLRDLI